MLLLSQIWLWVLIVAYVFMIVYSIFNYEELQKETTQPLWTTKNSVFATITVMALLKVLGMY